MLLVGLTGNIGSGKSTVARMLSERGATIIDADVLARRAVELGTMEIIAAQMPAELKRARADYIVENSGTLTQLERRVQDLWSSLMREANGARSVAR